ncbi:hypothetical protein V495_00938 [Pseudogymnoascus sp. VKM F-4514 (FW-929)]|nr:hypothetical protein V495_00938 [Pseudogymnoascus sp. VKM F-4514 (FW-929)]KFY66869.1 hypothetical protein V497_00652 [Pseudogymnoascus sp. VKM F-4516 (FW-969)]
MEFINKLAGGDNNNNNNGGGNNSGNNQYNDNQRNDDQYGNNSGNNQRNDGYNSNNNNQRNDDQYSSNNNNQRNDNQYGSNNNSSEGSSSGGGGFLDGLKDKMNSAAGGGRESEKNEDMLDKGIDFVQEKFLGQGKQDDESAIEQAKDEQISDFIRGQYKGATGSDIPIQDKKTTFN